MMFKLVNYLIVVVVVLPPSVVVASSPMNGRQQQQQQQQQLKLQQHFVGSSHSSSSYPVVIEKKEHDFGVGSESEQKGEGEELDAETMAEQRRAWRRGAQQQSPSKPSFLFLLADDLGWADFGYNNGTASTPNIDRWSKKNGSVIFQDFHSGGTVCSPTRATVLTGRNHFRDCVDYVYGCPDMTECVPNFEFAPLRTFTVGDAIRASNDDDYNDGESSFFAGKWHLGSFYNDSELYGGTTSSPLTHGFDHMNATVEVVPTLTTNCQCRPEWEKQCQFGHNKHQSHCEGHGKPPHGKCCFNYWWDDPHSPHGVTNLTWPTPVDDALYLADSFSRFLAHRQNLGNKPFMAQISFHNCHKPFVGTEEGRNSCANNITCRPPTNEKPYHSAELDYYSCLTQLDHSVGQILNSLEQMGYYENTMIWFTSDNGPENNCPPNGICKRAHDLPHRPEEGPGSAGLLRGRKRDIYEGGHRVPGIISWPAFIGHESPSWTSWETVITTDFLPTVMQVLNVDRPSEQQSWAFDGRSILPLLRNTSQLWTDTAENEGKPREFGMAYYNASLAILHGWGYRYDKWKYVEGSESCKEDSCRVPQLFNLEVDLGERHDLATEYPHVLSMLQTKFRVWHDSIMKSRREESHCKKVKDLPLPPSISGVGGGGGASLSPPTWRHDSSSGLNSATAEFVES